MALVADDLRVPTGAFTAVVGPNGSGKSTLLHAVAGLLAVRSGTLSVLGTTPVAGRRSVAYVLQSAAVNPSLPITVRQVVAMGRYSTVGLLGRPSRADRQAVAEALERVELSDLADRQLRELSGGQRQRAFVAQGLAQQADLLLLDEPMSGLDMVSAEAILAIAAEERDAGRSVVMTTHDLDHARLADHLVVLSGKVVAQGRPAEVLVPDVLRRAYGSRLLVLDDSTVAVVDDAHHHATGADHSLCAHDDEHDPPPG